MPKNDFLCKQLGENNPPLYTEQVINANFVWIGVLFALLGSGASSFQVLRSHHRANLVTWGLWTVIPIIAFVAEITQGVGVLSFATLIVGLGPAAIFFAELARGKGDFHLQLLDILCLGLSGTAILLWLILGKGDVAILVSILADFLAAIPTGLKIWHNPRGESYWVYLGSLVNSCIALVVVSAWGIAQAGFPLCILVTATLLLGEGFVRRIFRAEQTIGTAAIGVKELAE